MSNVPMTLPDLMLAEHETEYGHESTFVELEDGRILHVAAYWKNYSEDGGITWTRMPSEKMVDVDGNPVGGAEAALVKLPGRNSVGMSALVDDAPRRTTYAATPDGRGLHFWRSDDAGQTWSAPVRMTDPGVRTASYQDNSIRTSSGRIVRPVWTDLSQQDGPSEPQPPFVGKLVRNQWVNTSAHFFDPGFSAAYVLLSDDEGRTWQRNTDGELMIFVDGSAAVSRVNESSVTEVAPGRLLMFMRNRLGRLFQAWSDDDGETWTRPMPTSLAATTTPAQIRTLPTGHLLCVWNQENHQEVMRGFNRTRVSSAISRNGGSVWEFFQNVQSLHETTRVEPGPIEPVRPAEQYDQPGKPALERDADYIHSADVHGRWGYCSVLVMKDRVLITHTFSSYEDAPTTAQIIRNPTDDGGTIINQKLKVLPLNWFYGGKEPANNPFLKEAYEPARP